MSDKNEELKQDVPTSTTTLPLGDIATASPSTPVAVDIEEAQRFLDALAPNESLTFHTLPEKKRDQGGEKRLGKNRVLQGRFDMQSRTLQASNAGGAGVFVMVNRGDGKGRSAANVIGVRALFVDLDGSDLQPVLDASIPPSITVETSPGRYHAYWLVRDLRLQEFKAAQQALAAMFDGDKSVCDLPRILRVPGFLHQKSSTPFKSKLMRCEPELIWRWRDLQDGLGLECFSGLPDKILEGQRNSTLFRLAAASAITGTPKAERYNDLERIDSERCTPPLGRDEVRSIVDRAYRDRPAGTMKIPLALLCDQRFLDLTVYRRLLLILVYQKIANKDKGSEIPLLWKDFKHHLPRENTFKRLRRLLVKRGLLIQTKKAVRFKDGAKDWNLYKLAIVDGL